MTQVTARLRKILDWAGWLLSPFGSGHDFSRNPVLGSPLANRLGLHLARFLLAHLMTAWRRFWLRGLLPAELRRQFHRDGFVVLQGLLPEATMAALREEVYRARGEVRECVQGDTLTHRLLLDEDALSGLPAIRTLLENPLFAGAVRYVGARNAYPFHYIQSIRNAVSGDRPDPQKVLHSDTFHPTMKAWFFVEDVLPEHGPFTYVRGSHRLTPARLRWEYRRSLVAAALRDGYSEKGSFRFEAADLRELGLPDPEALALPANTLVVADTHGIHRRGAAAPGARRLEIWAYSRLNPFTPWPGVNSRAWARAFTQGLRRKWTRLDAAAARAGTRSSWHVVPLEELHRGHGPR